MWSSVFRQWKSWSLQHKLGALAAIATILGAVIASAGLYLDVVDPFGGSDSAITAGEPVSLVVEFENKHEVAVVLAGRGEAFFWYPGGGQHETGSFNLVTELGAPLTELRLAAGENRRVVATLFPVERVGALLREGHTDLSLFYPWRGHRQHLFSQCRLLGGQFIFGVYVDRTDPQGIAVAVGPRHCPSIYRQASIFWETLSWASLMCPIRWARVT